MTITNQFRSISFPPKSHPSTHAIEEVLDKLMGLDMWSPSTSGSICACLSRLEELYKCTDDVLSMVSMQQALSQQSNKKFLEELLDGSVRLMDLCSASRDLMVETNENVRDVLSGVRRKRKGDSTVVAKYVSFRKNMRKEVKKLVASLKSMDSRINGVSSSTVTDQDRQQLVAVAHVMKQVVAVSISIFQSFLEFFSGQNRTRGNKWSLVLNKLLHKDETTARQETDKKQENEFEIVDSAIFGSAEDLQKKLETLERTIGGFDMSLEGLFRRMIRTRTSLLNIVSQ